VALLVGALLLHATGFAGGELEVVQAVMPDWPPGADPAAKARVRLGFVVGGRSVVSVAPLAPEAPAAFAAESVAAFRDWLIDAGDADACGFTHGTVEFEFDAARAEPVTVGPLTLERRPERFGLVKLDRVEVGAGRIKRSELTRADALRAQRDAQERAAQDRWLERWRALGRAEPAAFVPEGTTPPRPTVRIEPVYPRAALERGVEGWVHAVMTVGANGAVYEVEVVDSEPAGVFDQPTRAALRRWKLEPGRDASGRAAEMRVCQTLVYRLTSLP